VDAICYDELVLMLRRAAAEIRANHETLSKLDSVGGDGDHGTTMVRAMACMEKAIDACQSRDMGALLNDVGWAIMGVDGGATGPLLGTLFMSMSESVAGRETLDTPTLASAFEAGLAGVRKQTKAQPGDKTMIDALVPAVEGVRAGADIESALKSAADAAESGAESTKEMQARFGRAKNIREQSIGAADPGATSIAFIFKGFLKGATNNA
jgi:dihydroxyacetone kinase-like protein